MHGRYNNHEFLDQILDEQKSNKITLKEFDVKLASLFKSHKFNTYKNKRVATKYEYLFDASDDILISEMSRFPVMFKVRKHLDKSNMSTFICISF